jgi:uncharacterized protein YecT (DUF1311 family)
MIRPTIKPWRLLLATSLAVSVSACAVHHVTPYVPDANNAPETAGAAQASASCSEASTAAEIAICAAPPLEDANRTMILALQANLRAASLFGRDALLASQRAWLLDLPVRCHLPEPPAAAPPEAGACLGASITERTAALGSWPTPASAPVASNAIAQYVTFRQSAGAAAQPDPAFCGRFVQRANEALRRTGDLDPQQMRFAEVAGSHGPPTAPPVSVDMYDANVFALFQRRARSVSLGGALVITPISLTGLIQAQNTANEGGRFSAFASQTGDYGIIDVFRDGTRLLALAADPWGSTTPAAPGEAAHAGVWEIEGAKAAPVCLFDTYTRPADDTGLPGGGPFARWRDTLAQIRDGATLPLGTAAKRDQAQLGADTDFTILHMPLLAVQQAAGGGWTPWLRARHDAVLDALFAWSTKDPANKALFNQAFALLRPAATELVAAYQKTQALSAPEATQAGGIAVMELLYQATTTIAPDLGSAATPPMGYKPRYPILAAPS